jgi:hypothetical protein
MSRHPSWSACHLLPLAFPWRAGFCNNTLFGIEAFQLRVREHEPGHHRPISAKLSVSIQKRSNCISLTSPQYSSDVISCCRPPSYLIKICRWSYCMSQIIWQVVCVRYGNGTSLQYGRYSSIPLDVPTVSLTSIGPSSSLARDVCPSDGLRGDEYYAWIGGT